VISSNTQFYATHLNLDHILTNIERLMLGRALVGPARGGISHVEGRVGCWSNTAKRRFGWDIGTVVCTHNLHDESQVYEQSQSRCGLGQALPRSRSCEPHRCLALSSPSVFHHFHHYKHTAQPNVTAYTLLSGSGYCLRCNPSRPDEGLWFLAIFGAQPRSFTSEPSLPLDHSSRSFVLLWP
jgi:hypothetical protein